MFTLTVKIADVGDRLMDLRNGNASDSSDRVVKIADGLEGCGVPTGRKNPRRRKIVKVPDSYDS